LRRKVASVTIANQIPLSIAIGERLDDLLRCPFGGRMFRDSEVKHLSALVL
jgi:hypothetical protein